MTRAAAIAALARWTATRPARPRRVGLLTLSLCGAPAACAPPVGEPAWALDTLTIDPGPASGGAPGNASAVQAWTLFDARWDRARRGRRLVCSAVVTLPLLPEAAPCADCDPAWSVARAALTDTDCPEDTAALEVLTAITGVAIGPVDPALPPSPVAGALGGWVRTDATGWVPHGWAWPQGAGAGAVAAGPWDGVRAFELWPAFAWSLDGTGADRDTDATVLGQRVPQDPVPAARDAGPRTWHAP